MGGGLAGVSSHDDSSVEGDFVPGGATLDDERDVTVSNHILGMMGDFKGAAHYYCGVVSNVSLNTAIRGTL